MRITDIKSFPVWVGARNQLVVKVETDSGLYGLGESGMSYRELAVAGAIRHFREFLIGQDPLRRGRIWQELYRSQDFEGGRVLLAAQSAIDIALYDIAGKALGVPVYPLLGGKQRDVIPGFATAAGGTGPEMVDSIRLHGTVFPVPEALGLGVEFGETLAAAQPWRFAEAPHFRRPDGSVTNW